MMMTCSFRGREYSGVGTCRTGDEYWYCPYREGLDKILSTLNSILKLANDLPTADPLSEATWSAFALFPRLILRPLPDGTCGKEATKAFAERCDLLLAGDVGRLLADAHASQAARRAPASGPAFPKTAL